MTVTLTRPDLEALAANLDPVDRFLELLGRPAWHASASCAGSGVDFFCGPWDREATAAAVALCAGCPVRSECEAFAVAEPHASGVWAGVHRDAVDLATIPRTGVRFGHRSARCAHCGRHRQLAKDIGICRDCLKTARRRDG